MSAAGTRSAGGPARRGAGTDEQRAAAAAAREARLAALHGTLAEGVDAIRDGQAWRDWLGVAGRFRSYSFRNQVLIAVQRPDATLVAGYRAWQAMGRQVRRGEKAIYILAPVTRRPAAERASGGGADRADPAARRLVVGFTSAAVFDVGQTDGDPLPEPPRPQLLQGHAPPGLWDALQQAIAAQGFTVGRAPSAADLGGANGVTDFIGRTVLVRTDVDDAQAVKTLAHEAAHVLLHDPAGEGRPDCRGVVEVEAESVAYLVAAHHGLPAGDYSFGYIAVWAGRTPDAVTATAQRVLAAARTLLDATDPPDPTRSAAAQAAVRPDLLFPAATGREADGDPLLAAGHQQPPLPRSRPTR